MQVFIPTWLPSPGTMHMSELYTNTKYRWSLQLSTYKKKQKKKNEINKNRKVHVDTKMSNTL